MTIIRIGLDTAKHVFQVHAVDENEQTVLRRQVRRSEMKKFFGKLAPTRIGLVACGASHYWAREVRVSAHRIVLLPMHNLQRTFNHLSIAANLHTALSTWLSTSL